MTGSQYVCCERGKLGRSLRVCAWGPGMEKVEYHSSKHSPRPMVCF